ncbi:N-acyl-D-glucosamine 2-epimerase [Paenibacillus hodogayensis]|uniref:N-acyl-D-glucosamine 2-epimerase n=1 Tax=Paenibacillus hodogayensis TaxID=279208 RepID=A0ABV5W230_9BACL
METTNSGGKARRGLYGPSIQVDPLFPYYKNRSPESVAEEIAAAGYAIVHYFVVNEMNINGELLRAFRDRGMFVWAMALGNGTFSTENYPEGWTDWRMGLLKPCDDGYERFSYFCEPYVQWKTKAIGDMLSRYPFDGIEIAEPYFPEWDGIRRGVYGDVGPYARDAFRRRCGSDMPDFVHPRSPQYYKKNKDVYEKWVQLRVEAVNEFVDRVINGTGGARAVEPDIAVATWSLAVDDGSESIGLLREMQGLDAPSMIARVKPDMHVLQTHWPDWTKPSLPSDYVRRYEPFVRHIRGEHASLPLAVQADIGSSKTMIKGREWLSGFHRTAKRLGYASWTAYEFHIGGTMYEMPPFPFRGIRSGERELMVSFTKRIDPESCRSLASRFGILDRDGHRFIDPDLLRVDGNRLYIRAEGFPADSFELTVPPVRDTPDLWLFRTFPANEVAAGARVAIPAAAR